MRYRDIKTIDQKIAENKEFLKQYSLVPDDLIFVKITIRCFNCEHERVEELGRYVDGHCYPDTLRCWEPGCGAHIEPPTLDDIERLIANARKAVGKP